MLLPVLVHVWTQFLVTDGKCPCHFVTLTRIRVSIVTTICNKIHNLPVGVFIAPNALSVSRGKQNAGIY
jgi:hypothetical protein